MATCFNPSRIFNDELIQYIEQQRLAWDIPGLSIGVVKEDSQIETHTWGVKDREGSPATANTLFGIGSCTKAFTATAIGIVIEEQLRQNVNDPILRWDSRIQELLPGDWELGDSSASTNATLRDILCHQSGLPAHDWMYSSDDTALDVTRRLRFLATRAEFRESWEYNNLMYMVTAEILTKYTGDYRQFIQDRILSPLGMSTSTFSENTARKTGQLSESWDDFSRRRVPFWFPEPASDFMSGPGGLISSAVDMTKWLQVALAASDASSSTVIPAKIFQEITCARAIVEGKPEYPEVSIKGYGLGWFHESYIGHDRVYHYGSLPGVSSRVSLYPDHGLALVILVNIDAKERFNIIIENSIADQVFSLSPKSWEQKWKPTRRYLRYVPECKPSLNLNNYAGTYHNDGYGYITLCSPSHPASNCAELHGDFAKVDRALETQNYTWQLQALWPRIWSSQIRLVSLGNHRFLGQCVTLFPHGFGGDLFPFMARAVHVAIVFVIDKDKAVGFDFYLDAYDNERAVDDPDLSFRYAHFERDDR